MGHWKGQYPWPFGRDPNSSVLQRDVESDRLIGNVLVTYVTLIPWRREQRRHVPSPRLLYHHWADPGRKTWTAPVAYLYLRCDQWQLDAIIACQCALARLVYTRSRLVSLSETWRLHSLLQGTRVTYITKTFHLYGEILWPHDVGS